MTKLLAEQGELQTKIEITDAWNLENKLERAADADHSGTEHGDLLTHEPVTYPLRSVATCERWLRGELPKCLR